MEREQKIRGMTNEEEKKAAMDKWFSTELAEWFTKLEAAIAVTSKVLSHSLTRNLGSLTGSESSKQPLLSPTMYCYGARLDGCT
jgi:hypothetical protein